MHDHSDHRQANLYCGRPRTYGLRFSLADGFVLLGAAAIMFATWHVTDGLSMLIMFVVLHFFLFCNIFRIRRLPELIWGAMFVLNCILWLIYDSANMFPVMACQLPITFVVIVYEICMPHYHGVFARRLNSQLDVYLAEPNVDEQTG